MSLKELARVPYWKALGIAVAGGAALLWLQASITAAVTQDNVRDDSAYASRDEVLDRLARIETKVDWLVRVEAARLGK